MWMRDSCKPFFCNLGFDIGTNAVCRAAEAFGLGSKTGLDFGDDRSGTVPDAFFGFLQETVLDACANQTSRIQQGYSSAAAVP